MDVKSTSMVPPSRNLVKEEEVVDKELPFKRGKKALRSLSLRTIVREGGFEATLSTINVHKGLIYLSAQVRGTNVSMLLDTGATNSFIMRDYLQRLELESKETAELVKVTFA